MIDAIASRVRDEILTMKIRSRRKDRILADSIIDREFVDSMIDGEVFSVILLFDK